MNMSQMTLEMLANYGFIEIYEDEQHTELQSVQFYINKEEFDKAINYIDSEEFFYQSYITNP